jgi:hypothetical protein
MSWMIRVKAVSGSSRTVRVETSYSRTSRKETNGVVHGESLDRREIAVSKFEIQCKALKMHDRQIRCEYQRLCDCQDTNRRLVVACHNTFTFIQTYHARDLRCWSDSLVTILPVVEFSANNCNTESYRLHDDLRPPGAVLHRSYAEDSKKD